MFQQYSFILLSLLFLLPNNNVFAQSAIYDSLFTAGRTAYRNGDYDAAQSFYLTGLERAKSDTAETLATELEFKNYLGDVYRKKRDFDTALSYYDDVVERAYEVDENVYVWGRQNRAVLYYEQHELVKAINEYSALLPLISSTKYEYPIDYGNTLMNLANNYNDMNDYVRAEDMMLKALAVFEVAAEPDGIEFNRIYNNLGVLYRGTGDYPLAIEYAEKALGVKLKNYASDHPSVSKYYFNLGGIYLDAGQAEKALPLFKKTLELDRKNYGEQHYYTIESKGSVGDALAALKRYDEALQYYQAADDIPADDPDATHPDIIQLYLTAGEVYQKMEQYENALKSLEITENRLKSVGDVPPAMQVDLTLVKAEILQQQDSIQKAVQYVKNAVQILTKEQIEDDQIPDYTKVIDHKMYIVVLEKLAELYTTVPAGKSVTTSQLKQSFSALEAAISTIQWLRTTYHSNEARQYLNNETEAIFTKAVGTAYELYQQTSDFDYLKKAFYLAEAGKANILRNVVNEGLALRSSGIPTGLLDSLDDLRNRIGGLAEELEEAKSETAAPKAIEKIKNQRFQLNTQHAELVTFFEEKYPNYYALKFGQQATDLNTIQSKLAEQKTTLLSYFYDNKYVYCFHLSAKDLTGTRRAHDGKLAETITNLRTFLTPEKALNASTTDAQRMTDLLQQLSEWTLPDLSISETQQLLIVPHGLLYYLPFEILPLQQETNKNTNTYLIQTHSVYYSVSADFWAKETHQNHENTTESFVGFAPKYNGTKNVLATRGGWSALQWNVSEVESVQHLLGGTIFTATEATEDNFRQNAPQANILHLAMHATVDDKNPQRSGLVFSTEADPTPEQKLNLYEIYNLNLNAETVVINACNTGYGKLAAGEGVLSLAHAFNYAGAQNTLMNLWLADDEAASKIVVDFYKNMQTGVGKAAALRQAKIQYLAQADPLRSHPYFWAGLVLQGDGEQEKGSFPFGWLAIGILGLAGLGWSILRYK
ncbi:MAG: CHAT domain-containing protein [Saprospiraceae bacterium]